MKDIGKVAMDAARAAVQREINWLKEERERLEAWMRPEREALEQREQEVQKIDDKLRGLEEFMRSTKETPQVCASCKKRGPLRGARAGENGLRILVAERGARTEMKARAEGQTTYYVIPARGQPFSFILLPRGAGRRAFEAFMDAVTGRNRVIPYQRDLIEGARISKGGKQE